MSDITFVGGPAGSRQPAAPAVRPSFIIPSRRLVWIAGGVAVLLLLAVIYLVAGLVIANAATSGARTAIRTMVSQQASTTLTLNQNPYVDLPLQRWSFDIAGAKADLAVYEKRVANTASQVKRDRAALQAARASLGSSWLTLLERGSLRQEATHVESALSALAVVDRSLAMQRQEADFLHPFLDGLQGLQTLDKTINATDIQGALTQLSAITANIERAVNRAVEPAVPPTVIDASKTVLDLLGNSKGVLDASVVGDTAAMDSHGNTVSADANKLDAYDLQSTAHYEQLVLAKLTASYSKDMSTASAGS